MSVNHSLDSRQKTKLKRRRITNETKQISTLRKAIKELKKWSKIHDGFILIQLMPVSSGGCYTRRIELSSKNKKGYKKCKY